MDCLHKETVIREPHLAGLRKCLACGKVYYPKRIPPWDFEESSKDHAYQNKIQTLIWSEAVLKIKLSLSIDLFERMKRNLGTKMFDWEADIKECLDTIKEI